MEESKNDFQGLSLKELQDMHSILKETFNVAVKDYKEVNVPMHDLHYEVWLARIATKTSVATTAQALLQTEREIRERAENANSFKGKNLGPL